MEKTSCYFLLNITFQGDVCCHLQGSKDGSGASEVPQPAEIGAFAARYGGTDPEGLSGVPPRSGTPRSHPWWSVCAPAGPRPGLQRPVPPAPRSGRFNSYCSAIPVEFLTCGGGCHPGSALGQPTGLSGRGKKALSDTRSIIWC